MVAADDTTFYPLYTILIYLLDCYVALFISEIRAVLHQKESLNDGIVVVFVFSCSIE